MAGYSRIYCLGGEGGFMGADGINPILLQIWVGDSSRQWLEGHRFDGGKKLGQLGVIVPAGPRDPNALLDATIAFFPDAFTKCPSLEVVRQELGGQSRLDFHLAADRIPPSWARLREEARPIFDDLILYEAHLERFDQKKGRQR